MNVETSRIAALTMSVIFVAVALAPIASATHMSVYYLHSEDVPLHPGLGTWREDGNVVPPDAPAGLAGLTERVRAMPADVAGQGGRVLNAFIAYGPNPLVNLNYYAGTNHLYPGMNTFMAWYGAWNDLNTDGVIDDYPPSAANPADEFLWEGFESGRTGAGSTSMNGWILPSHIQNTGNGFDRPNRIGTSTPKDTFGAWSDVSAAPDFLYTDRTARSEAQPFYVNGIGWFVQTHDEGFLMTTTVLTAVEATRAAGTDVGYDLTVAEAYRDVDIYQSVDPTVEALWMSTIRGTARPTYDGIVTVANDTRAAAVEEVGPFADAADAIIDEIAEMLPDTSDIEAIVDEAERFQDDATWGFFPNERRLSMAGNDYASGYDGWVDAWTRSIVPTWTNIDFSTKHPILFAGFFGERVVGPFSPTQDTSTDRRQIGAIVNVFASAGAWHDVNGDGWIGAPAGCTSEDDSHLDDDGYCKDSFAHRNGGVDDPHNYASTEFVGTRTALCGLSAELTPVGGEWPPGTGILRTHDRPTQRIDRGEEYYVPLTGSETARLRFDEQCAAGTGSRTMDALFLPSGSFGVNLHLKVSVELPKIIDTSSGVDFPGGTFTDEDMIVGAL